jgi:antitoxin component of RelBE/YafQ-DinJ toxin-antitoxin module
VSQETKQYIIKNVPASVDRALKKRAKELGLTLSVTILLLLKKAADESKIPRIQQTALDHHSFDHDWEHL